MADNRLFRTALFGGYNKEDVEEYIKTLEHEIESIKVLHQKEKSELQKKAQEAAETTGEEEEELQIEIRIAREETEKLRLENEELKEKLEKLRTPQMEQPEQSVQQTVEEIKKEPVREDEFFDYDTVNRIMEDARRNAAQMEKEAADRAEQILERARVHAEQQKDVIVRQINAQLEEKGIQLIAAKYKIEQYAKEIENAQMGLGNLNSRIREMAENMPVRLDNYWDGEPYRTLISEKEKENAERAIDYGREIASDDLS